MPDLTDVRETAFAGRSVWLHEGDRESHVRTWRALDPAYAGSGPCGLLTLLPEPDPEAEWADPRTLYVGRSADGRQGRIAYFSAAVAPARPDWTDRAAAVTIVPFAAQTVVTPDDLIALWTSEGVLRLEAARRRVDEVLLIAVDGNGRPAGVSSCFLEHNEQLRMDLWYVRVFVAAAHRTSNAATALAVASRDHLQAAFLDGRDTRAAAMAMVVQSEILKRTQREPVWSRSGAVLIGETTTGDHVRVVYFTGARVPVS